MLQPVSSGLFPLSFDGLDSQYLTVKGGEAVTLKSVDLGASVDLSAADADDGYVGLTTPKRVVVAFPTANSERPVFLCDDGTTGYGTLFGTVVGGVVGQVTSGTVLGPHTATGSGKITCWDKPGLYQVSLDAVDTDEVDGLVPENTALAVGSPVHYALSTGLLTSSLGTNASTDPLGYLVEFTSSKSKVTSNLGMVSALNSPSGSTGGSGSFTSVIIHYRGASW